MSDLSSKSLFLEVRGKEFEIHVSCNFPFTIKRKLGKSLDGVNGRQRKRKGEKHVQTVTQKLKRVCPLHLRKFRDGNGGN